MTGLVERLPVECGRYIVDAPMGARTWLRAGGLAEVMFFPRDADGVAAFLRGCPEDIAVMVMGAGSNLLVRDGGVRGVVIAPGASLGRVVIEGARVIAGAAAPLRAVAAAAQEAGIGGMEFLDGIPGRVGGGLAMNAGAHGGSIADIFVSAKAFDRHGDAQTFGPEEMGFGYRECGAADGVVFVEAVFGGEPTDTEAIAARMAGFAAARAAAQKVRAGTGGSAFRNPPGHSAWKLIDAAGCRGLRRGDAMVCESHCNFLFNRGSARAEDLEALGEEVRARVERHAGVRLEWEIRTVGEAGP